MQGSLLSLKFRYIPTALAVVALNRSPLCLLCSAWHLPTLSVCPLSLL